MASKKISELDSGNPAQSGDQVLIAREGKNYRLSAGSVAALRLPAGSNLQIQFNDDGSFAGNANLTFNKTSGELAVKAIKLGTAGSDLGSLSLSGNTSGVVTVRPAATAGTWTLTLPTGTGTSGQALVTDGSGATSWSTVTAGSDTQVQFNDNGSAGVSSVFTFNKTTTTLGVPTLALGTAGSTLGSLSLAGNTSGVVTVRPAATAGTWTLTLPTGTGSAGQFLRTDGNGNTSWFTATTEATGETGEVQFNSGDAFGSNSSFVFDAGTTTLSVPTLALGTAGSVLGSLTLAGNTSGVVTVRPAATAGTWTLTLPSSAGTAGQYLQTNGSGALTWATVADTVPGGSNGQLQYNNSSAFGGASGLTTTGTELTIASGTKTTSTPLLDMSQTWNAGAVTFTGLKLNVTDTASASGSLLADLQVGGVSKFKVSKNSVVTAGDGGQVNPNIIYGFNNNTMGIYAISGNRVGFGTGGYGPVLISTSQLTLDRDVVIGWAGQSNMSGGTALTILRETDITQGALAQRNGTNAQTFRIYNTYTDASNYERGFMRWNSNALEVGTEAGGTGTNRALRLAPSSKSLQMGTGNGSGLTITLWDVSGSENGDFYCQYGSFIWTGPGAIVSNSGNIRGGAASALNVYCDSNYSANTPLRLGFRQQPGGNNINGNDVYIFAQNGSSTVANNRSGGSIYLDGGQGYGTGTNGDVIVGNTRGSLLLKGGGTVTADAPPLQITQTWNNAAVAFSGLKLTVTNTASASSSSFATFATSVRTVFNFGANGSFEIRRASDNNQLVFVDSANSVTTLYQLNVGHILSTGDITGSFFVKNGGKVQFSDGAVWNTTLLIDSANNLAQRNGTNAQTFRLYNTYTDASNYERGFMRWNSNVLEIGTEKSGTGSNRDLRFVLSNGGVLNCTAIDLNNWTFSTGIRIGFNVTSTIHGATAHQEYNGCRIQSSNILFGREVSGDITISGENRTNDTYATGTLKLLARSANASATTNIVGGVIQITGGAGASASAGAAHGGSIYLDGGQGYGTGSHGNIVIGNTRGNLQITDARDVVLDTSTGTKIGTATSQKIGFWNATPIVQPANTVAIDDVLVNTGLRASGGTANFTTAVTAPNLANGKTLQRFTPLDNQPPATNFATLDTRNSVAVLDFDDGATNEEAVFVGVIPQAATLTSGIKVRIFWAATSATSGDCRWGVQFEKYGTDIDSDSFDIATEAHTTTSGTSGIVVVTEITSTSIDSLVAGDQFRLKVYRDSSDTTNDTMTGDAELVAVEVQAV